MKKITSITTIAILVMLSACLGGSNQAAGLAEAERAFDDGNYEAAQDILDDIFGKDDEKMSATQLGRMSILYMRIADECSDDADDNIGAATKCYMKAYNANADSAQAYYYSLPIEHSSHVQTLSRLHEALTAPPSVGDSIDHADCRDDSLPE